MAIQLNISADNKTHTLTSGVAADILSTYLAETSAATTQHIKMELVRNCCASSKITILYPPKYTFTLNVTIDTNYVPVPFVPTTNNRQATFVLGGISHSLVAKFEVETNSGAPNGTTTAWVDVTSSITNGYSYYYAENAASIVKQIRITTIDNFVYLLNVTYDWANTPPPTVSTTTLTIVTQPSLPTIGTVDFVGNTIKYTASDWGLSTTDDVFLDGVYQYNLTQVETGADKVESVNKFFNIKLRCLVTKYIATNLKDTEIGLLMGAMDLADSCNLTASQKCALYGRITRKLLMANQIKASSPLGCGCGCS